MELFAVFETWHLGDGNYPALENGQLVNLSFEIEPEELTLAEETAPKGFHYTGQAEYEFTGVVLRVYREDSPEGVAVIEADRFCFYLNSPQTAGLAPGDVVSGRGTLVLDHYLWVEFLSDYDDPPDLFYSLRVGDIWRVRIPERFIMRKGSNVSYPAWVKPDEDRLEDVTPVDAITDDEYVAFIVHFFDTDVPSTPIRRTFHS